ncbi:MAG: phosphotransferase family protein [Actinomycetes bacterium]
MSRRRTIEVDTLAAAAGRGLGTPVTIEGLRRLSGGASRETWSFDACTPDGTRLELVLRRDPGAHVGQVGREAEFDLLRAVGAAGVAVPRVRFLLDAGDDLGAGFVMDRIEGETIARRILRDEEYGDARTRLTAQCGEALARIHATPLDTLPALDLLDAPAQIAQYRGLIDGFGAPHPAFELALRWLADHAPPLPAGGARLVHGDFRNGNFIVGPEGIRSVLDWELSHLGDPIEDLGWVCVRSWRFGVDDRRVGGFGDLDDLIASYVAAGGDPVDPEHVRYWEVFGTLKWGVICQMQCAAHEHGFVRSVENAALGRRVAETEWDLLTLIAGPDPGADPGWSVVPMPAATAHDVPTVANLVAAVREYLERDVMPATEGRVAFHARVATNVLGMVERELAIGPGAAAVVRDRLADLLGHDAPVAALIDELATSIRDGAPVDAATLTAVRETVRSKLAVSNPDYAGAPD